MLSGPSFRSAFIFSFISLIFSSFPLTSLHLAEASNLLFCGFTLLCVQMSKNITKCLLPIIVHIFSTHFAINLFYLHNLKTKTNYKTTAPCMGTNEIKAKTKLSHVTFKLTMYCIVRIIVRFIVQFSN